MDNWAGNPSYMVTVHPYPNRTLHSSRLLSIDHIMAYHILSHPMLQRLFVELYNNFLFCTSC
jgi:hypothetical protein